MKTKDMEIERILDNLFEEQTLKSYADWLCKNSFFEDVIVKYISCIKVISDYYNKTTRKKFFDISNVNTLKEFYKCLPIEYQKSKYKLAYKYYLYWIGEKYPIVDIQKFDIKIGCSVTQRVKQVKQPRGGLLDLKRMQVVKLGEGMECLNSNENVHANLIGLTVDYLTRFMSGTPVDKAFSISILGSKIVNEEKMDLLLREDIQILFVQEMVILLRQIHYGILRYLY